MAQKQQSNSHIPRSITTPSLTKCSPGPGASERAPSTVPVMPRREYEGTVGLCAKTVQFYLLAAPRLLAPHEFLEGSGSSPLHYYCSCSRYPPSESRTVFSQLLSLENSSPIPGFLLNFHPTRISTCDLFTGTDGACRDLYRLSGWTFHFFPFQNWVKFWRCSVWFGNTVPIAHWTLIHGPSGV